MKIHTDIEQNSVDWMILRSGKITASEMDALISPTGEIRKGDMPKTYLAQKLAERWTGGPLPSLQGIFDMEQGKILEERAKPAFTLHTGIEIQNVAFIESDDGQCGCSPDGFISVRFGAPMGNFVEVGTGVEIKCPRVDTHIGYLLAGVIPKQYIAQVQGSMFVTGFAEWHFFSYRSQFPPLHLIIVRDEKFQANLKQAVADFCGALDAGMKKLEELNGGPPKRFTPTPAKAVGFQDPNDINV